MRGTRLQVTGDRLQGTGADGIATEHTEATEDDEVTGYGFRIFSIISNFSVTSIGQYIQHYPPL